MNLVSLKIRGLNRAEVFFKIKTTAQLWKLMDSYCKHMSVGMDHVVFLFDGTRIREDQTAADLLMEDGDCIVVCEAGEPSDPTTLWRRLLRKALADPSAFGDVLGRTPPDARMREPPMRAYDLSASAVDDEAVPKTKRAEGPDEAQAVLGFAAAASIVDTLLGSPFPDPDIVIDHNTQCPTVLDADGALPVTTGRSIHENITDDCIHDLVAMALSKIVSRSTGGQLDVILQRRVVTSLRELSCYSENKARIVERGGLKVLINLVGSSDREVQRGATAAFAHLVNGSPSNKLRMARSGGLEALLHAAASADDQVRYYSAWALVSLSECAVNREAIVRLGGAHTLCSFALDENTELQRWASVGLLNLVSHDAPTRQALLKEGGVAALVKLSISSDVPTLRHTMAALGLMSTDEATKVAIVGAGGFGALVSTLRSSQDALVRRSAVAVLVNLSANEQNKAPIANSAALTALLTLAYANDVQSQLCLSGVLANLATSVEKEHIVDSGGLAALLGLTDASDVRVLRCVAAAFVNLTVSMELKARFLEAGGLVALNTLLHEHDSVVHQLSNMVLAGLAVFPGVCM